MKSFKFSVALILSLTCLLASATDGRWSKNHTWGNLEFFAENGSARLYISCPTRQNYSSERSFVAMTLNGKDVNSFKIYANGKVFAGPFTTDTRKNTTKFIELIDALNQDDAVVNHGRWQTVFERSNISSVLPTYMSNNFNCDIN